MSTRSPILEYSDNNPIPTYTPPVGDTSTSLVLADGSPNDGNTVQAENGDLIQFDVLPPL